VQQLARAGSREYTINKCHRTVVEIQFVSWLSTQCFPPLFIGNIKREK